jgi:7-carboxy-7-deazaguanine synthase
MKNTYLVNEIFETLQGEATFTGTPSVFIRLQGCEVGCHWCDTKHTWAIEHTKTIPIADMMGKTQDAPTASPMSVKDILDILKTFRARHIVITGGEPAIYNLNPLTAELYLEGYSIQLETSGTHVIECHPSVFITVSPKVGMAGGFEVLQECLEMADEIKYPVGKLKDVEILKSQILTNCFTENIWLQPLSQNNTSTKICVEQATINGWRVSIQTHKFIGMR